MFYSVTSYWNLLPGIFQDEYIYSVGARKIALEEQDYPNYLFSIVFQITDLCGAEFYSCAKGINTGLLILFIFFVYLIASTIHSRRVSVLLASVAALSATTIFASFFMPEMLFFTLNIFVVWILLRISTSNRRLKEGSHSKRSKAVVRIPWAALAFVAVGLALAILTKRHELFFLPGYTLAIYFVCRAIMISKVKAAVLGVVFGLLTPLLMRQLFVFAVTGNLWSSLLGSTYSDSFRRTQSSGLGQTDAAQSIFDLLSQGFWHLIFHSAVGLLAGLSVSLVLSKGSPLGQESTSQERSSNAISRIALSLTISIVPIVAFFESYLTLAGDDHSLRLLARYFEFLFIIIMISATTRIKQDNLSGNRFLFFATLFGYLVFIVLIGPLIQTGPADSPTIHGLKLLGPWILLFMVTSLWAISRLRHGNTLAIALFPLLVPALILSSGIATRLDAARTIGTEYSYFDYAGQYVASEFSEISGDNILVIGTSRAEVVATKFSIDKDGIRHSIQPSETKSLSRDKLSDIKLVVVLFPAALVTKDSVELVHEANGFLVYLVN